MSKQWVVLCKGTVWHAKIVQAQLDGYGIPNLVPDPFLQISSPFVMAGAFVPDTCVMVPAECEEEARALLEHSPDMLSEEQPLAVRAPRA